MSEPETLSENDKDAESAAIRARMEAYVPPELDESGEVVPPTPEASVEIEQSAETIEAGSELATDPTETIIFNENPQIPGGEGMNFFYRAEKDSPETPEAISEGYLGYQDLGNFKGKYTEMNGFIAYVPNIKNPNYCLVAGTPENFKKIKEAGYESAGGDLGVISFNGDETLKSRARTGKEEYMDAQVELIKSINESERLKSNIDAIKQGEENAVKYLGTVEQATAKYEEQLGKVEQLRASAKQISADKPWGARTALAA